MADKPGDARSKPARFRAYLRHNRDRMLVDVMVIAAWLIVTWAVFRTFVLPAWAFYLVLFIGVIVYSRVTSPWLRPYRPPELNPSEELQQGKDDRDDPQ